MESATKETKESKEHKDEGRNIMLPIIAVGVVLIVLLLVFKGWYSGYWVAYVEPASTAEASVNQTTNVDCGDNCTVLVGDDNTGYHHWHPHRHMHHHYVQPKKDCSCDN